jgi:hypothetical protein
MASACPNSFLQFSLLKEEVSMQGVCKGHVKEVKSFENSNLFPGRFCYRCLALFSLDTVQRRSFNIMAVTCHLASDKLTHGKLCDCCSRGGPGGWEGADSKQGQGGCGSKVTSVVRRSLVCHDWLICLASFSLDTVQRRSFNPTSTPC